MQLNKKAFINSPARFCRGVVLCTCSCFAYLVYHFVLLSQD
nr:MAG TPA_asm: hypothetical protein [Caudoviricetes sp.]